jgi:hypothetical protein
VVVSGYVLLRRRGPVAMRQELELSRREGIDCDVGGAERSDRVSKESHPGPREFTARAVLNHSMSSLADQTLNKMARQTVGSPADLIISSTQASIL